MISRATGTPTGGGGIGRRLAFTLLRWGWLGVGGVMAGVWWIIGRRAKLADEAASSAAAAQDAPPEPSETMPSPEKREKE